MMKKHIVETLTGAFVIVIAIWFVVTFVSKATDIKNGSDSYVIQANFQNVEGIESGSSIMIGGVKVGVVLAKELDPVSYFANLKLSIDNNIKIPEDSTVNIASSGLLGEKFVSISPGGSEKMLATNGELKYTQSSVNLETLIGKMIFMKENTK